MNLVTDTDITEAAAMDSLADACTLIEKIAGILRAT
jgi:hypothetical protein